MTDETMVSILVSCLIYRGMDGEMKVKEPISSTRVGWLLHPDVRYWRRLCILPLSKRRHSFSFSFSFSIALALVLAPT